MPFTLLSHQAPVMYFYSKYPKRYDLLALIISSIIPDLEVMLENLFYFPNTHLGHSLLGIILWSIPLSLIFTFISINILKALEKVNFFSRSNFISEIVDFFGYKKEESDYGEYIKIIIYSAILGSSTHLLLDFISHDTSFLFYPIMIFHMPDIMSLSIIDFGEHYLVFRSFNFNITFTGIIWLLMSFFLAYMCILYSKKIKNTKRLEDNAVKNN